MVFFPLIMKRILVIIQLFALLIRPVYAQTPGFITDSLERYIQRGMAQWQIPGMALAIIKDGRVIVSKGYGVREVGKPDAIDEQTLFLIASNTKLFTGTALANLEEQKKLSLDESVLRYLPDFKLYQEPTTQLVTLRDLLSHRLGTEDYQGDFLFWDTNLSRTDVVNRLRLFKPVHPFRQNFGYCNAGFVTAGEVIPKVTGITWDDYVRQIILSPLGMTNTFMSTTGVSRRPNLARPYTSCCNATGQLIRLPYDSLDNIGPAGGMVSCTKDLIKWVQMQLDSGRYNAQQILPWPVIEKTRIGNTLISTQKPALFPRHFQAYGLGIGLLDYAGRMVYTHFGGAFGFKTSVCFVPEEKLGIIILTNQDNHTFFEALRYQILDAYLNVTYTDRNQYFFSRSKPKFEKQQQDVRVLADRVSRKTKLNLPLATYSGTYRNDFYGTLSIQPDANTKMEPRLKITFQHHPALFAWLDYMDGDNFRLTYSNPRFGTIPIKFSVVNQVVQSIEIKVTDFVDDEPYLFKKTSQ